MAFATRVSELNVCKLLRGTVESHRVFTPGAIGTAAVQLARHFGAVLFLKKLVEDGKYRPVIDRRYRLEDVIEATKYVETEQKTGNVVLTLDDGLSSTTSGMLRNV
jgi:hypothetical protein